MIENFESCDCGRSPHGYFYERANGTDVLVPVPLPVVSVNAAFYLMAKSPRFANADSQRLIAEVRAAGLPASLENGDDITMVDEYLKDQAIRVRPPKVYLRILVSPRA